MKQLLKKEWRLCLHPAVPLFLLLSALILVPNYPYAVCFFYLTLGIYFTCLAGRENHDLAFTLSLPVSRGDIVAARFLMCGALEVCQILLAGLVILLRERLLGGAPNAAGMDANLALPGEGFLLFGLFNLLFFPAWYRDVNKLGVPFLRASAAVFLFVVAAVVSTYALPFVRDVLDTPDPAHLGAKAAFTAACAGVYLLLSCLSFRLSRRRFEHQDLQV